MGPFNKLKAKAKPRVDDDDEMRGVGVSSRVKSDGPVGSVSPTSGARPTKSRSFHAPTELQRSRSGGGSGSSLGHGDGQTVEELRDTVVSLKQSVMSHANSSAEAMEHFNALQKAHDTLYKEHVHLQEQMDDAVELLKYLKEEKGAYEARLEAARREAEQMRRLAADQGDGSGVVSMTIENLTKEKMDIEGRLRDEVRGREELGAANAGLAAKVAELTRTNAELEKRSAKAGTIEKLEGECRKLMEAMEGTKAKYEGEATKARLLYEAREAELRTKTESDAQSIERLTAERDALLSSHATIKEQVTSLGAEMEKHRGRQDEVDALNSKLASALSKISQMQREKRESDKSSSELASLTSETSRLASANKELLTERDDMRLYVSKIEERLAAKDEALEEILAKGGEMQTEVDAMKDRLVKAEDERTAMEGERDRLRAELESAAAANDAARDENDDDVASLEGQIRELEDEREEMRDAMRENAEAMEEQLRMQKERLQSAMEQEREEMERELASEKEALLSQIRVLKDQLESSADETRSTGSGQQQRGDVHAQLEREMQERLAKRLAAQLRESKANMEQQIREELEARYAAGDGRSVDGSVDGGGSQAGSVAAARLREQLLQVKEERERWQREQEEFTEKIIQSQKQFEMVREGFKKKIEKEKAKSRDLEGTCKEHLVVIDRLSEEYQSAMVQIEELQDQLESADGPSDGHYTQEEWDAQLADASAREEEYESRIGDMQVEIEDLQNGQAAYESDRKKWEAEAAALQVKFEDKHDEFVKAMDDLEQLNSENEEYARKIESYEENAEALREQAEDYENSRVKYSALQIDYKEIKMEMETLRSDNSDQMRQMEMLNSENADLQKQNQTLEEGAAQLNGDLTVSREERDRLHDSLRETTELLSDMETKVATLKTEKEDAAKEHQNRLAELESELAVARDGTAEAAALAAARDEAVSDLEEMRAMYSDAVSGLHVAADKRAKEIDALKKQLADSSQQVTKLIDQLSNASDEKTSLSGKLDSATADLNMLRGEGEGHRKRISELESTLAAITEERDAANQRAAGSDESRQAMSALMDEKKELTALVEESKAAVGILEAEKATLAGKITSLNDCATSAQVQAETLMAELTVSRTETAELMAEIEISNATVSALEAEKQRQAEAGADQLADKLAAQKEISDAEASALKSEIESLKAAADKLNSENAGLEESLREARASAAAAAETVTEAMAAGSSNADLEELKKDLERAQNGHKAQMDKIKLDMRDIKDKNILLEDGLQDIQVEKEDLEAENEELVSKLTDLTTQAKKMLLNNEQLEEEIQDQQIEYEDRIAELEARMAEEYENADFVALQEKHSAALETIVSLKANIDDLNEHKVDQTKINDMEASLKKMTEKNIELSQMVDHLTSENEAAKEIKFIVLELRSKNMEMAEVLRRSQEEKDSLFETIDALKADNAELQKDIVALQTTNPAGQEDSIVPYQYDGDLNHSSSIHDPPADRMSELEAELQHYKSLAQQLTSERSVFNQRLDDIMGASDMHPVPGGASPQELALSIHAEEKDRNTAMSPTLQASAAFPPASPLPEEVEEQINHLTIENGQLAQRLGGALAEKEFAMTTLSKLGAKMEELMERNKLLSNIADLKTEHASRSRHSYEVPHHKPEEKIRDPDEVENDGGGTRCRGLDPEESDVFDSSNVHNHHRGHTRSRGQSFGSKSPNRHRGEMHDSPQYTDYQSESQYEDEPSRYLPQASDEPSTYTEMESTILSYDGGPKQLEPESASSLQASSSNHFLKHNDSTQILEEKRGIHVHRHSERHVGDDESSAASEYQLVKVPGGEYYGMLNELSQKHGQGKMRYDNGNEYEGQWKYNKRDGKGTTKYASGNVYTGTWKAGKRHGFGVFNIKKTGDIYRGNWEQGLKSGPGVYEYEDGEIDVSFYQEDIRVGEGVRWSASRHTASRLVDGQLVGEEGGMLLEDATRLTKQLGFVV